MRVTSDAGASSADRDSGHCSDNVEGAVLLKPYAMVAVDQARKSALGFKSRQTSKKSVQQEQQQKAAEIEEEAAPNVLGSGRDMESYQASLLSVSMRLAALEKAFAKRQDQKAAGVKKAAVAADNGELRQLFKRIAALEQAIGSDEEKA